MALFMSEQTVSPPMPHLWRNLFCYRVRFNSLGNSLMRNQLCLQFQTKAWSKLVPIKCPLWRDRWSFGSIQHFHIEHNAPSSEAQGQLVGTIECSWWKFTIRSRRAHGKRTSSRKPHTCNSNQLRVCIVNFCSLVSYNKHLELYQLIETHKPDIIIGTETHLNKDIDSREIFPPNYV